MGKELSSHVLAVAALFLLGTARARPGNETSGAMRCDEPPILECRIVGGSRAGHNDFPFQVSLQERGYHICGGTLLDNRHVLTAAHCVTNRRGEVKEARSLEIGVGSIYLSDLVKHEVTHVWRHDQYELSYGLPNHDIAIVRVKCCLNFTQRVRPVALWNDRPILPPLRCNVSGWGTEVVGGAGTSHLYYATVPVRCHSECQRSYKKLPSHPICAGEENRDSCQGDSGGPLICDGKLAGVVSFGYKCGLKEFPGVYTDVTAYVRWSEGIIYERHSKAAYLSPALTFIFFLSLIPLRYF